LAYDVFITHFDFLVKTEGVDQAVNKTSAWFRFKDMDVSFQEKLFDQSFAGGGCPNGQYHRFRPDYSANPKYTSLCKENLPHEVPFRFDRHRTKLTIQTESTDTA